jgi:hypothetical protein
MVVSPLDGKVRLDGKRVIVNVRGIMAAFTIFSR